MRSATGTSYPQYDWRRDLSFSTTMTDAVNACPACGTSAIVRGRLTQGRPGTFSPEGLRFWTLNSGVLPLLDRGDPGAPPMTSTARACTSCGLVWTYVDPAVLRTVLDEAGNDETRARFARDEPPQS